MFSLVVFLGTGIQNPVSGDLAWGHGYETRCLGIVGVMAKYPCLPYLQLLLLHLNQHKSLHSQLVQQKKSTTMPPPSALSIKTSSVIRLIKEEASYHKEAVAQEKVIEKLENEGGDEYELRQQVRLPR